jgi:hypothetical protein
MIRSPLKRRPAASFFALLAVAPLVCGWGGCDNPAPVPSKLILIDNIHSSKQAPEFGMPWNDYRYSSLNGEKKLFDFLSANGYPHRYVTPSDAAKLTPEVLRGVGILMVDLIDAHGVDYAPDEIETVRKFVKGGGGLLVIGDHTNVYEHARRSNALLKPLGVEIDYGSGIERDPDLATADGYWIHVQSFADHPVTRGVGAILFQTGATLSTAHGIAFLSPRGFRDDWYPNRKHPSKLGNGLFDVGEKTGPLPLVAAGAYGRGRFVVLGDENLFANSHLYVANTFEFAANTFEWLAGAENTTPPLRARMTAALRVGFDLEHAHWNIIGNDCDRYHPFYIDFNRAPGMVSRGLMALRGTWDVLVFTDPDTPFTTDEVAYVRSHAENGGTVIVLTDVRRPRPGAQQLLAQLIPGTVFEGRRKFGLDRLPAGDDLVATVTAAAEFPLTSSKLAVKGLHMAGHSYSNGARCGLDVEKSEPYVVQVTASGGEPLLQAQVGHDAADLARVYAMGKGRIVVFFQDGFFRNETMGLEEYPPGTRTADAHRVVYELTRWLLRLYGAPGGEDPPSASTNSSAN